MNIFRKPVAIIMLMILIMIMGLSCFDINSVKANADEIEYDFENENVSEYLVESEDLNDVEYIKEAEDDRTSEIIAGRWGVKFEYDLPWGYFHLKVQEDIRSRYGKYGMLGGEKQLKIGDNKYGRADLLLLDGDTYYIWEVKPYSYVKEELREKGRNQLYGYVHNKETDGNYKYDYGYNYKINKIVVELSRNVQSENTQNLG